MATKLPPIHPGEVLDEDFMAPRGLTANQLALDLRVPANRLSEVIRGRRSISADSALGLARYFGTSAEAKDETGARIEREVAIAKTPAKLVGQD